MRIGRYRLLREIGEGGFGTVWLAEQVEPVSRQVALKIIKPGMDTRRVIARFEAERQALAMMDHSNIAQVFDAGATDAGRPYFVMELVRGERITVYCDRRRLPVRDRLDLFITVCHAVQHAHQKGIIHRDLKPSNILVTSGDDGRPVPKIIDFGVAKATQAPLSADTAYTRAEQMIGTPAYMAPEQAGAMGDDIDTRCDIYSLGVLLYELLAGRPAFDGLAFRNATPDRIVRMICEVDPVRPSACVQGMSQTDVQMLAQNRRTVPARLIAELKGDLDWIVMKALEKDRSRRYQTANSFAADVRRFLSDEAVSARPPAPSYRLRKFVKRHRAMIRMGAAAALILLASTVVSIWLAVRAMRAEARAREKAADEVAAREAAEEVTSFISRILRSPSPSRDGRTVTVAELLDRTAEQLSADFDTQPERRAVLGSVLARSYFSLGLAKEAIPLQEKVRDFWLSTRGIGHHETRTAIRNLAQYLFEAGRRDEALALRQMLYDWYQNASLGDADEALTAASHLSRSYYAAGRFEEALQLQERILGRRRALYDPMSPDTISAMHDVGRSYFRAGRLEEAFRLQEEVVRLRREVAGENHPSTLMAISHLARTCFAMGLRDRAMELRREVFALRRRISGPEHPDTIEAMLELAGSELTAGNVPEAVGLFRRVVDWRTRTYGPDAPSTLRAVRGLAEAEAIAAGGGRTSRVSGVPAVESAAGAPDSRPGGPSPDD